MITAGYLISIQFIFTILFMVYYIFLRKEKFLVLNRFILIIIIASAFVLPVTRTFNFNGFSINKLKPQLIVDNVFPQFAVNNNPQQHLVYNAEPAQKLNYATMAMITYFIIAAILLIVYLVNLLKVYVVIRTSHRHKANGLTYCESFYGSAPFSFFNFIVISKSAFNPKEYTQIVAHESAHCRQWHSLDVFLADMACVILWINPLIYLYYRELKLNLEFLADEAAINSGVDTYDYQLSLLQHLGILKVCRPANPFFNSKIKERIITMNKAQPSVSNGYKYVLLLPVILALSALTGFQKDRMAFKDKVSLLQDKSVTSTSKLALIRQPVSAKSDIRDKHLNDKPIESSAKQPYPNHQIANVFIDARTDTVKFRLITDSIDRRFKGIYVIDDKILSDDEIRAAIKSDGKLEMILANRPAVGMYSANDSSAIKKWGEQARPGVVFVTTRPDK